jgi:hypothetical protein
MNECLLANIHTGAKDWNGILIITIVMIIIEVVWVINY